MTCIEYTSPPNLCFVICPIGQPGSDERIHSDLLLDNILRPVLEAKLGFKIKRADHDPEPGMVGEQIIRDIVFARLVIADLSYLNPNVLYELGIRHAALKPTIHLARTGTVLPFDNFGYRTIFFNIYDTGTHDKIGHLIQEAVESATDRKHLVRNPITQASVPILLRELELTQEERVHGFIDLFRELKAAGVPMDKIVAVMRRKATPYDIQIDTEWRQNEHFLRLDCRSGMWSVK